MAANHSEQKLELQPVPEDHIRLFHLSVCDKEPVSTWNPDPESYYAKRSSENDSIELFITNYRGEDEEHGLHNITIKIEISCYHLNDLPPYCALSYRWGPVVYSPVVGIHLSGGLLECLPWLAEQQPGHWWVDAVCINQDNEEEKIHQIHAMSRIFAEAHRVVAYIGPRDSLSHEAIKLAHNIYNCFLSNELEVKNYNSILHEPWNDILRALKLPDIADPVWLALFRLRLRPYFTRVWMIQEILLAQEVMILCGSTVCDWNVVEFASEWMNEAGLVTRLSWKAMRESLDVTSMPLAEIIQGLRFCTNALSNILFWSRHLAATEPKDKIIGIMALLEDSDPIKRDIESFYKLPVPQLYTRTTKAILGQDKNLGILKLVDSGLRSLPGLPSWVPDYSARSATCTGRLGHLSGAANGQNLEMNLDDAWNELTLQVKTIDEVAVVTKTTEEINVLGIYILYSFLAVLAHHNIPLQHCCIIIIGPGELSTIDDVLLEYRMVMDSPPRPMSLRKDIDIDGLIIENVPLIASELPSMSELKRHHKLIDAMWRTLIKDGAKYEPVPHGFRIHFLAAILLSIETFAPGLVNDCAMLMPRDWKLAPDDAEHTIFEACQDQLGGNSNFFFLNLSSMAGNRAGFITKFGRFGFGPISTKKGSIIALAPGAEECLVLDGTDKSRLHGMAFIHGLMNGEGLDDDTPWEKIVLR